METLSKNRLASLRKLRQKKIRRTTRTCLIEGEKLILEALTHGFRPEAVIYERGKGKFFQDILQHPLVTAALKTDGRSINQLTDMDTAPGIFAELRMPHPEISPGADTGHRRYIALDGVSDPSNVGAILRTASWYGYDGVLCGNGSAEILNGKTVRASMGAVFHFPVWEDANLPEELRLLKNCGFTVVGTAPRNGLPDAPAPEKYALVIGSESHGIGPDILDICDILVTLPGAGKAESLNAAVCAGILMDRLAGRETTQPSEYV